MRIVHHFTKMARGGGGVPRAVLDLARLLGEEGDEVTLLTAAGSEIPEAGTDRAVEGVRVVGLDRVSRPLQVLSRKSLTRIADTLSGADVVHLHGLWRPRNHQIARLALRMRRPYVLSPHGMLNGWAMARSALQKAVYYRVFERRNLAGARRVHFSALREQETARRWVPHGRLSVIPLAVDLRPYATLPEPDRFESAHPEIADGLPIVLMLGRLHPSKQPEVLIEAIGNLRRSNVACRLVLAGDGSPAYVSQLHDVVSRYGISDRAHFLGHVAGQEKLALYRRADLFALPTQGENFGLVLFESLACGTPVLTTREADTWSEISASGGGRIVEPTAEAFAANMAELLAADGLRSSMGHRGREWVFDWLDPKTVIGRYREMYREALGDGS